jgi:DNA-binding NarL/FixJ family response regulator
MPLTKHNPIVKGVVLAVYSQPRDQAKLRSIFVSSSWKLHEATSCAEAIALLRVYPIPVVICDADLPDGSWRDIFAHLALFRHRPRLIVASHHLDNLLRTEAFSLGVHSVLSTPFRTAEVSQAVNLAWREWNRRSSSPDRAVA